MNIRTMSTVLAISAVLFVSGCSARDAVPAASGDTGSSVVATPSPTALDLTSSTAWQTSCKLTEAQVNSALAASHFVSMAPQNYSVVSEDNQCYYKNSAEGSTAGLGIRIQKYGAGTVFGTGGDGNADARWTADSPTQGSASACAAYGSGAKCQPVPGGLIVVSGNGWANVALPDGDYFYTFNFDGDGSSSNDDRAPAMAIATDLLALGPIVP